MLKQLLTEAVLLTALNNIALETETAQIKSAISKAVTLQDIITLNQQFSELPEDASRYVDPVTFEIAQDIREQFNFDKGSQPYKNAQKIYRLLRQHAYERIE